MLFALPMELLLSRKTLLAELRKNYLETGK